MLVIPFLEDTPQRIFETVRVLMIRKASELILFAWCQETVQCPRLQVVAARFVSISFSYRRPRSLHCSRPLGVLPRCQERSRACVKQSRCSRMPARRHGRRLDVRFVSFFFLEKINA